jgi:hypothetical protein
VSATLSRKYQRFGSGYEQSEQPSIYGEVFMHLHLALLRVVGGRQKFVIDPHNMLRKAA